MEKLVIKNFFVPQPTGLVTIQLTNIFHNLTVYNLEFYGLMRKKWYNFFEYELSTQ